MATITKTNTFTNGATIIASEHNTNFDTIYNEFNGNIDNANLKSSAAIVDTKLEQITTAGKVSGVSITLLTSLPSGAGEVPIANIPTITLAKGGTGQNLSSNNQGDIYYDGGSNAFTRLTPGTAGQVARTGGSSANPSWVNSLSEVLDFGTSASSSTSRQGTALKLAYGTVTLSSGDATISNLNFADSTFAAMVVRENTSDVSQAVQVKSKTSTTLVLRDSLGSSNIVHWFALGN